MSPRIALATARAARGLDEDMAPLLAALQAAGARPSAVDWDDPSVDWAAFDLVLPRSTWDYSERLPAFMDWLGTVGACTRLLNPVPVLRWNIDKHYLATLAAAGVTIVPSRFVEPGDDATAHLDALLAAHPASADVVVKPAVGAGSRDAERHPRTARAAALAHIGRLLAAGRSALLQPYLDGVDARGETALVHFDGVFSHAIRKGPLLQRAAAATQALFAAEDIRARAADADEQALARQVLAALPFDSAPVYARVDLIRADDGTPCLLELELIEPSLFLDHAPVAATRFAACLMRHLAR